jgi:hypothetical protein
MGSASGLHRFDHFNRDVVGIVEACMGPTRSPKDFVACTFEGARARDKIDRLLCCRAGKPT